MASRELTSKQRLFVQEYLVDLNATQAAARAGYSPRTANEQGARLLANVSIQAAIAAGQEAKLERLQVSQDWVVSRLKAEAERCGEDASHAARVRALELLGRHVGMWPARLQVEQTTQLEVTEVVCRTRLEAAAALSLVAGAG